MSFKVRQSLLSGLIAIFAGSMAWGFGVGLAKVAAHQSKKVIDKSIAKIAEEEASDGDDDDNDDTTSVPDIPLNYTLGSDYLGVQTTGGVLKVSIGPWGSHSQPHTGHSKGDPKSNWIGAYAYSYSDLTELAGDGDTVCEVSEV